MTGRIRKTREQFPAAGGAGALTAVDASLPRLTLVDVCLPNASRCIIDRHLNNQSHRDGQTAFSPGKCRGFLTADDADSADQSLHSPSAPIRVIRAQKARDEAI